MRSAVAVLAALSALVVASSVSAASAAPAQARGYDLGRISLGAIVLASCDGDTGPMGRTYLRQARRQANRTRPVVLARLEGANHNFFNRKLAQLGADDAPAGTPRCRRPRRLSARAQQRWLDLAADFFGATLRGARRPTWLRAGATPPSRVYGRRVLVRKAG